jgi:hypothetical protein
MPNRFGLRRIAIGIGVVAAKGLTGSDTLDPEHPFELGRVELVPARSLVKLSRPLTMRSFLVIEIILHNFDLLPMRALDTKVNRRSTRGGVTGCAARVGKRLDRASRAGRLI